MSLIHQLHRLRIAQGAGGDAVLDYLNANYNLDHWFASDTFQGASSDGDNITGWQDKVTTTNATVGGANPIFRVTGGRNYASFNEGSVTGTRGAFVMTEANFSAMGFSDSVQTIFIKSADITNTSEQVAYEKGKENRFATGEHSLKIDTNSATLRHQGTSGSSASFPGTIDGLWLIVRTDGSNTRLYTYLGGTSGMSLRRSFTNGTASDTGHLAFGSVYDESNFAGAGAEWKCSDLLFFSDAMTTTEMADVADYIDDNT